MNIGDRSRIRLLDKLAKQRGWRSLCIVGVKDDLEAKSLLQWCRNLAVTVVWQVQPAAQRAEKARQLRCRDRMRQWTGVYKRFALLESSPSEAAEELAGREFDAVALWRLKPAQLAKDGAAWAALVRDGGTLVGTDHRIAEVRAVLKAAVAEYRQLRDGVWMVEVRRSEGSDTLAVDDVDVSGGADVDGSVAEPDTQRAPSGDGGLAPAGADVPPAKDVDLAHAETIAPPAPKRRGGRPKGSRNKPKVAE